MKKQTVYNNLIFTGVLLLTLTYEKHIRDMNYEALGILGIVIIIIAALLSKKTWKNKDLTPLIFIFALFLYPIFNYAFLPSSSLIDATKPAIQLVVLFAILYINIKIDNNILLLSLSTISFILSVFSILIYILDGFMIWEMFYNRSMSVFFDANYASAVLALGCLCSIALENKKIKYLYFSICLLGSFLAFSKGTSIALIISLITYMYYTNEGYRKYIIITFISFVLLSTQINILNEISKIFPALRVEMGLNLRDIYWKIGLSEILNNPLATRKAQDVILLISPYGINTSLHNTYIESSFLYSLIFGTLLILLIILSMRNYLLSKQYLLLSILFYLAVSANNFTFMLGSPNILSFFLSILIINSFKNNEKTYEFK